MNATGKASPNPPIIHPQDTLELSYKRLVIRLFQPILPVRPSLRVCGDSQRALCYLINY